MIRQLLLVPLAALALTVATAPPAAAADQQFTLTADYVGLYPNADLLAPVSVHNPLDYAIAVHTADVAVGGASPTCPASNLVASSFSGDVTVPAGGDATIPIRMQMPASAPDTCQGAVFPLTFHATGEPVSTGRGAGTGTSGFAFTGSDTASLTLLGTTACALGALIVVATRRRPRVPSR